MKSILSRLPCPTLEVPSLKFAATLFLVTAIFAFAFGSHLRADTIDFSYTLPIVGSPGEDVTATGVLTVTPRDQTLFPGMYIITGITGTRTVDGVTQAITGLLPPGTFPMGGFPNDNHIRVGIVPYLSFNGFAFTVAGAGDDGSGDIDVFYRPGPAAYFEDSALYGGGTFTDSLVSSMAGVPEPMPPTLAVLAMFGAVGWWRKKRLA
jgi:hypothetical protein